MIHSTTNFTFITSKYAIKEMFKTKPFLIFKNSWNEKNPQNSYFSHFKSEPIWNNTWNSSGVFHQNDKVTVLKMTCYYFLKTLNLRQNLHSRVIQKKISGMLLVYSNKFCWTVLVYKFKRGHSVGILSLKRVQRTSVILRIDRSIYHFTFLIIFALCRKTIHDSKYYTNWK